MLVEAYDSVGWRGAMAWLTLLEEEMTSPDCPSAVLVDSHAGISYRGAITTGGGAMA